jgi:polysaccharide export outer membrane protein
MQSSGSPKAESTMPVEDFGKMVIKVRGGIQSSAAYAASAQIIYPGDILTITTFEKLPVSQEPLMEKKRVDEDGKIFVLSIGEIQVDGLSLSQAEKLIEERMSEYVVSPHCEIEITKRGREPLVYVFGETQRTGVLPIKRGDRLMDVIANAGGCKNDAYYRSVKIVRVDNDQVKMFSINLYDIIRNGKIENNFLVQDQDIVFVPRRLINNLRELSSIIGTLMPWYNYMETLFKNE